MRGRRVAVVGGSGGAAVAPRKSDSVRGGAKGGSRAPAVFNRLGPKLPVKARLGGKSSVAGRSATSGGNKGMAITIGSGGGGRVVAKKVDVNSYTTIDEVGQVDVSNKTAKELADEKKEQEEIKERERKLKERLLKEAQEKKKSGGGGEEAAPAIPNLDTVVIKRRSVAGNKAAADKNGKTMTIKTPNNLVAKLAAKLKELPKPGVIPAQKSDKEKVQLKKKIKDKYKKEQLPEKILYLALENVAYDESRAILLISKMLKDDAAPNKEADVVTLEDDDEEKLDFEADEPEN